MLLVRISFALMAIVVVVQSRPHSDSQSNNIQVISRSGKKHKNDIVAPVANKSSNKESTNPRTLDGLIDLYAGGIVGGLDLLEDAIFAGKNSETTTARTTTTGPTTLKTTTLATAETPVNSTPVSTITTTKPAKSGNYDMLQYVNNLTDILIQEFNNSATKNREPRAEDSKENEIETTGETTSQRSIEATTFRFDSSERQEEEDTNAVAGLISMFLGQLSKPDGTLDVEALVGLIGGLSVQKEDGTYDFQGLSDLLMGFFGGEGGSDVAAFVGGLLGAAIKGLAKPPGAKGAGIFAGTVLNGILPGLSGPPPPPEGEEANTPKPTLDSGSFLAGLIKTVLGGSSAGNGGNGGGGHFAQLKNAVLRAVFKVISSVFSVSSSSSHKG